MDRHLECEMPKPRTTSTKGTRSENSKAGTPSEPPVKAPAAERRAKTREAAPKGGARATPPSCGHDTIAERAYELFVEDGGRHGRDLEHWLRAEKELRGGARLRQAS